MHSLDIPTILASPTQPWQGTCLSPPPSLHCCHRLLPVLPKDTPIPHPFLPRDILTYPYPVLPFYYTFTPHPFPLPRYPARTKRVVHNYYNYHNYHWYHYNYTCINSPGSACIHTPTTVTQTEWFGFTLRTYAIYACVCVCFCVYSAIVRLRCANSATGTPCDKCTRIYIYA